MTKKGFERLEKRLADQKRENEFEDYYSCLLEGKNYWFYDDVYSRDFENWDFWLEDGVVW